MTYALSLLKVNLFAFLQRALAFVIRQHRSDELLAGARIDGLHLLGRAHQAFVFGVRLVDAEEILVQLRQDPLGVVGPVLTQDLDEALLRLRR